MDDNKDLRDERDRLKEQVEKLAGIPKLVEPKKPRPRQISEKRRWTMEQVAEMRRRYEAGETPTQISKDYDCAPSKIGEIVHFKYYKLP